MVPFESRKQGVSDFPLHQGIPRYAYVKMSPGATLTVALFGTSPRTLHAISGFVKSRTGPFANL